MSLKVCQLVSILLLTLVSGMYWGPWLALTRSMSTFEPSAFLAIVRRLTRNMAPLMAVLTPIALLSTVPVLFLSFGRRATFALTLVALVLFLFTVLVTMVVEVPIVRQIMTWTESTLPGNWQQLRDRWVSFHLLRVVPSFVGLVLLVAAAIF
jgi:uncharacterized membrane protein